MKRERRSSGSVAALIATAALLGCGGASGRVSTDAAAGGADGGADAGADHVTAPGCSGSLVLGSVPRRWASGSNPHSIAVGDFDRDGRLDVAVAQTFLSVSLGKGDGTFSGGSINVPGADPDAVVSGDFDGDGKLDLAVTDSLNGNVGVMLGNGDGTFKNALTFAAGGGPYSITASDFNGDGKLDVAVILGTGTSIAVLLGRGDGTLAPAVTYAADVRAGARAGNGSYSIASPDLNGDGKRDLVAVNPGSARVSVLLGNGDGTFAAATGYSLSGVPNAVVSGDFDGDGSSTSPPTMPPARA